MRKAMMGRFAALGLATISLAGCNTTAEDFNVYDTGSTDPDRFAAQTYPIWARPVVVEKPVPVSHQETTVLSYSDSTGYPTSRAAAAFSAYGTVQDAGHQLAAVPVNEVEPEYLRREVHYSTHEKPGTIVVDTGTKHLYFILGDGRAIRYGVGIGKSGYAWKGRGQIQYKRSWPKWTPSDDYVSRRPDMKMFSASYGGLVGGTNNPLGARALYIYAGGKDTLFRVHGTPDWKSVGKTVSSGCIRMFNHDVIDLYSRVGRNAQIVVI